MTQTRALLPGSAALDAGDNTLANNALLTTDQRGPGFARIVDGPDADTTDTVDIGAFEAQVSVEDITDKAAQRRYTASVHLQCGRRGEHHFGDGYVFEYDAGAEQSRRTSP